MANEIWHVCSQLLSVSVSPTRGEALSIKFLIRGNGREQFGTAPIAVGLHTRYVSALLSYGVKQWGGAFAPASGISVRVIFTDEERMIATSVCGVLGLHGKKEN